METFVDLEKLYDKKTISRRGVRRRCQQKLTWKVNLTLIPVPSRIDPPIYLKLSQRPISSSYVHSATSRALFFRVACGSASNQRKLSGCVVVFAPVLAAWKRCMRKRTKEKFCEVLRASICPSPALLWLAAIGEIRSFYTRSMIVISPYSDPCQGTLLRW